MLEHVEGILSVWCQLEALLAEQLGQRGSDGAEVLDEASVVPRRPTECHTAQTELGTGQDSTDCTFCSSMVTLSTKITWMK
jgi:hypothetical protein